MYDINKLVGNPFNFYYNFLTLKENQLVWLSKRNILEHNILHTTLLPETEKYLILFTIDPSLQWNPALL